jgi:hypothetical protein
MTLFRDRSKDELLYEAVKKATEPIFDVNDAPKFINDIKDKVKVPVINAQVSTLGGADRASIMVTLSLDPQEEWFNGILHNSRYMMFRIDRNGRLEQFSLGHTIKKKMRKTFGKTQKDIIDKMNKYISQVK